MITFFYFLTHLLCGAKLNSVTVVQILSDIRCFPSCARGGIFGSGPVCPPGCFQYKGTMDVFYKVVKQVWCSPFSFCLTSFCLYVYHSLVHCTFFH